VLLSFALCLIPRSADVAWRETVTLRAVLEVDQLAFTRDERPILLWGAIEGKRFELAASSDVTHARRLNPRDSRVDLVSRFDDLALELDGQPILASPILEGRSILWSDSERSARLLDAEAGIGDAWRPLLSALASEQAAWSGFWSKAGAVDLATVPRLLAFPGGLVQLAPDPGASGFPAVLALSLLADVRGTASPQAADDGDLELGIDERPDGAQVVRSWWRELWADDAGYREADEVRSQLRLEGRARLSAPHSRDVPPPLLLTSEGDVRLRGDLRFITRNPAWPAPWTCTLDVRLKWKTRVEQRPSEPR
jgi:hypothetical protein